MMPKLKIQWGLSNPPSLFAWARIGPLAWVTVVFVRDYQTVTFCIHEVFWWVGHICLISFPVVVRLDDGTQSTLLIEFRYLSNCPGKEMSVCSNFSLKLSFYWVRRISLTSSTIVVRKDYADQSTMTINFSLSGLSVCSNFEISFEWGFLVSQAHLPKLASSCSKKEPYSSIHNEDQIF